MRARIRLQSLPSLDQTAAASGEVVPGTARSTANRSHPDRRATRVGGEQLIKRVLGHADGSVTAIYNRYGYVKEMSEVLERWTADLTAKFDAANMWSEPEMVRYVIVEPTEAA